MTFKAGDKVIATIHGLSVTGTIVKIDTASAWPFKMEGDEFASNWYREEELEFAIQLSDEAEVTFGEILDEI